MLSGIYSASTALRTAEFQQDVVATNLAHINVPGFRRSSVAISTFAEELDAQSTDAPGYGNRVESLDVDFSLGPMVETGRSLDVAIQGDGFFAVQGESETYYTRNGTFAIGQDGQLVGSHGMPILGVGGPLTLPPESTPAQLDIAPDGTVSIGDQQIGQLQLVRFDENSRLSQIGTTLFSAKQSDGSTLPVSDEPVSVAQGVREQSNVTPVDELVAMIVSMRYHEAAQRTLKTIDDSIQHQTDPRG